MTEQPSLAGQTLDGKYRLDRVLGAGGMGSVHLATHLGTDRTVAVKLIRDRFADHEEFVARFQREARAAGRLRHPNIVDITDFGHTDLNGQHVVYLVMEYLEGSALSGVLEAEGRLPLPWVVDLAGQLCAALQLAHDRGILHRDLKPDNLWLVPNGQGGFLLKILDFGLAKLYDPVARRGELEALADEEESATLAIQTRPMQATERLVSTTPAGDRPLTEVGTILGTPAYMSPEQCRGARRLDPRSDIYSVGVILYQMFTGETPFKGDSLTLLDKHMQATPPDLGKARPDLPTRVAALVNDCLQKDPDARPRRPAELAARLQAAATSVPTMVGRALEAYAKTPGLDLWFSFRALWPLFLFSLVTSILCWCFLRAEAPEGLKSLLGFNGIFGPKQIGLITFLLLGTLVFGIRAEIEGQYQFFVKFFVSRGLPQMKMGKELFSRTSEVGQMLRKAMKEIHRSHLWLLIIPMCAMGLGTAGFLSGGVRAFETRKDAWLVVALLGAALILAAIAMPAFMFRRIERKEAEAHEHPLTGDNLRFVIREIIDGEGLQRIAEGTARLQLRTDRRSLLNTLASLGSEPFILVIVLLPVLLVSQARISLAGFSIVSLLAYLAAWLYMPFGIQLGVENTCLLWEDWGLDLPAILRRLRARFFPGKSWFDRQG